MLRNKVKIVIILKKVKMMTIIVGLNVMKIEKIRKMKVAKMIMVN